MSVPDTNAAPRQPERQVDPRVLEMLVCPLTKTRLSLSDDRRELISQVARLAFPIRQGVPLLSLDEARELLEDEVARIIARRPASS